MEKMFEALEIGILKLKKLYENSAKKMSKNDILGFYLTFVYLDKALAELKAIKESKPSEAIRELKTFSYIMTRCKDEDSYIIKFPLGIEKGTTFGEDMEKAYKVIKQYILKAQEQDKENEILKEIIKSLFDRGCPLHQYNDTKFGLVIEVDDECSITHLGEFKGVDLDKKLKEVLNNE